MTEYSETSVRQHNVVVFVFLIIDGNHSYLLNPSLLFLIFKLFCLFVCCFCLGGGFSWGFLGFFLVFFVFVYGFMVQDPSVREKHDTRQLKYTQNKINKNEI